jgi:hypothetical protein
VGHGDRRGPWRIDVKSVKFSNRRVFLQNDFKKIRVDGPLHRPADAQPRAHTASHASLLPSAVGTPLPLIHPFGRRPRPSHAKCHWTLCCVLLALRVSASARGGKSSPFRSLFVRLTSHQPAVLFSQNKPATSNQPAVLFSQNKSAPAITHKPNKHAVGRPLRDPGSPAAERPGGSVQGRHLARAERRGNGIAPSLWDCHGQDERSAQTSTPSLQVSPSPLHATGVTPRRRQHQRWWKCIPDRSDAPAIILLASSLLIRSFEWPRRNFTSQPTRWRLGARRCCHRRKKHPFHWPGPTACRLTGHCRNRKQQKPQLFAE